VSAVAPHTDGSVLLAAIDELRRIVKNQHGGAACSSKPLPRAEKVPSQNLVVTHSFVRKKSIRGFCTRPILASEWDAATDALGELFEKSAESLAVPPVFKPATRNLAL